MKKINVLMVGPSRATKGGMASVVNLFFDSSINDEIDIKYIDSTIDKNILLKIITMIKGILEYKKYIKWCDVVHIHVASRISTFRKMIYTKIAKKFNKKVILHIHGGEYKIFYDKECSLKKKKNVKEMFDEADKVVVLSNEWKKYFSNITNENKIVVVKNSVFVPENYNKDYTNNNAVFLGMINQGKGIYDLLFVVKRIIKEFPDFQLIIGGAGEIDKLNSIIKDGLINNVKYIGWIGEEEKKKVLTESSIFILPSYNEGMPMSILEAMSYKNICISTDVGGIPSVIKNGVNGFMIKPGNKEELYNILKIVLTDKDCKKNISENAYETISKEFNVKTTIKEFLNMYKELCENKGE